MLLYLILGDKYEQKEEHERVAHAGYTRLDLTYERHSHLICHTSAVAYIIARALSC